LVLLAVVAGFAVILYLRVRTARYREIDAGLEAVAQYLDVNLRRLHGPDPEHGPPPPPGRRGWPDHPLPPPRPLAERLWAELDLPMRPDAPDEDSNPQNLYFGVWLHDDTLFKARGLPDGVWPPEPGHIPPPPHPRLTQHGEYREATMMGPAATRILVGRSVVKDEAELRAFAWQLAGSGALVLAVGLAGGWFVSARILRPVATISATASAISASNLTARIDPAAVDRELLDLAHVLNATFDRLQAAFERQARFTADASHELRTPLAILRSQAELALSRPRTPEEYEDVVEACLRAANRMTTLVEGLLILARADAFKLDLEEQAVDLGLVIDEGLDLIRPLAESKGIFLTTRLTRAEIHGDPVRLAQVVTNLLSNAVQATPPGGRVEVSLRSEAGEVVLAVTDTGSGVPEEDRAHLFERFYRVDKARSRASGGNGLGLAISKSIVEAHGGTIGFETELGRGSTFWVRLPLPAAP
jgi:heavy metal sensor kinase